jgi:hypothetical protein
MTADTPLAGTPHLKVVSQGTGKTTRVLVVREDGTETDITGIGITSLIWAVDARGVATVTLEISGVELNAEGVIDGKPRMYRTPKMDFTE